MGMRGPMGPDCNPIGTVISFMGTKPPKDYLVCDGSIYNINDVIQLAEFFKDQFGICNYFGGDGINTFAVPDLRNKFLRGYKGDSEEQLSGEIGERQEGTSHVNVYVANYGRGFYCGITGSTPGANVVEYDERVDFSSSYTSNSSSVSGNSNVPVHYKARPLNVAVLYCIKSNYPTLEEIQSILNQN